MVGYVYSVDREYGYRYILITCYNVDNINLVTDSMPYCVYRFCRTDGRAEVAYMSKVYDGKRLSLNYIMKIFSYLKIAEYENEYPVIMEWAITPSGICNKGRVRDLYIIYPISAHAIEKETSYVNITPLCFKKPNSYFEATFLCDILNEVFFLFGITHSDLFLVCGNQIFCSKAAAVLAKRVFGYDVFRVYLASDVDKSRAGTFISLRKLIKTAERITFNHSGYSAYDNKNLVTIKRECVETVVNILKRALLGGQNFLRSSRLLKLCIARTLFDIKTMSLTFLSKSGAAKSTDVNYISFDYLMTIFNFPVSHTKTRARIANGKERFRRQREFLEPVVLYRGQYYDEKR